MGRRAGQNIYNLAAARRFKAILALASGIFLAALPAISRISIPPKINILPFVYWALWMLALLQFLSALTLWIQANSAHQGAKGEA